MSVIFKKTAVTLTHYVAPKCKRIEIEPEQSQTPNNLIVRPCPEKILFLFLSPPQRPLCFL